MSEIQKVIWKPGQKHVADAHDAHRIIEEIRSEHDGLAQRHFIVDRARPADSVLHPEFEWDDAVAAEEYRKDQAGELVRALIVVSTDGDGQESEEPAYISVTLREDGENTHGYMPTQVVVETESLCCPALADAIRQLEGWLDRYSHLGDLSEITAAVETVKGRLG